MFHLPKNALPYTQSVITRCNDLIDVGICDGINELRFKGWLNNFKSEEEQYFSACILDGLIYRSKDQVIAMIEQLFQRTLPDLQAEHPMPFNEITDWIEDLKKDANKLPLRLVAVKGEHDPGTISSNNILRHMEKEFGTNTGINSGIKTFIFIDDFMGTGTQFQELCDEIDIKTILRDNYVAFTPLVSHVEGLQSLSRYALDLKIKPVEILNESHGIFSPQSSCFYENTGDDAEEFYCDLVTSRGLKLPVDRTGYGKLEILYAIEGVAPDNCLPILWHSEPGKWNPLFAR